MPNSAQRQIKRHEFDEILNFGFARHAQRYPLRCDVRIVRADGEISEAVMVDISQSGMGMDALLNFEQRTRVDVYFPNGFIWAGRMIWRDAFYSGMLFDKALSVFQLEKLRYDLGTSPRFEQSGSVGHSR